MKRPIAAIATAAVTAALIFYTAGPAVAWNHCGTPQAENDCPTTTVPETTTTAPPTTIPATTTTVPETTTILATTTTTQQITTTTTAPATTTTVPATTRTPVVIGQPVTTTTAPAPLEAVAIEAAQNGQTLAFTGSDAGILIAIGTMLLLAGAALTVGAKRRRNTSTNL